MLHDTNRYFIEFCLQSDLRRRRREVSHDWNIPRLKYPTIPSRDEECKYRFSTWNNCQPFAFCELDSKHLTYGYVFLVNGGPVTWTSKVQKSVTEAIEISLDWNIPRLKYPSIEISHDQNIPRLKDENINFGRNRSIARNRPCSPGQFPWVNLWDLAKEWRERSITNV